MVRFSLLLLPATAAAQDRDADIDVAQEEVALDEGEECVAFSIEEVGDEVADLIALAADAVAAACGIDEVVGSGITAAEVHVPADLPTLPPRIRLTTFTNRKEYHVDFSTRGQTLRCVPLDESRLVRVQQATTSFLREFDATWCGNVEVLEFGVTTEGDLVPVEGF